MSGDQARAVSAAKNESRYNIFAEKCPTRQVVERVGDKWTLLVINALEDGPARFSALQNRIQGINQKVLTGVLRGLERDGLVRRTVFPTIPPRVDYELTDLGLSLLKVIGGIRSWAYEKMDDILEARESYGAERVDGSMPA